MDVSELQRDAIVTELQGVNDEIDYLLYHGECDSPRIHALFAHRQSLQHRWLEQAERMLATDHRSA
jgi:hypothetical protein